MNSLYGMQRANGDWFALDDHGRLRVPVFHTSWDAMQARACNFWMLLFKPVRLDEHALNDLSPIKTAVATGFWLVDNPSIKLRRGQPLEHDELALLMRDATEQPQT